MAKRSKKITINDIEEVTVVPPKPNKESKNEQALFAHQHNMQKAKLGIVGMLWGSKSEKPGNIAAIVLIVLLFFVGVLLFTRKEWDLFSDTLGMMMSTITLILGYLFGSSTNRD